MLFLTAQPLWLSAIILVGIGMLLAMAGPVIVRRCVTLERLSTNNEVAGFKFATLGVLYAVLLAFAVIVVWEKFDDAEHAVATEAGAATTIYRLVAGIGDKPGAVVRDRLTTYLKSAINEDWAAMERGGASAATTRALDEVYAAVLNFTPGDLREASAMAEILRQLDQVTQARRDRVVMATGIVPGIVWLVLFGGAVLTIGFTFFFGTESLLAQTMMAGALAILIFSALLIIVAIDHPFTGAVKVESHVLSDVLTDFSLPSRP